MLGKKEFNVKYTKRGDITYSIFETSSEELLVGVNRIVRFNRTFFFFLNGKRAGFPLVFREYGTGRCCSVQNIQIDSYIHTRGRTSMDFAFAAIVNDFEALAASWF